MIINIQRKNDALEIIQEKCIRMEIAIIEAKGDKKWTETTGLRRLLVNSLITYIYVDYLI